MSKILGEFNHESISDILVKDSPQNDESIESENNFAINILSDKLIFDNDKVSEFNGDSYYSFSSDTSSSSSVSLFKEEFSLEKVEQINEVKYNIFMIMYKNLSYHDEYNNIFSISEADKEIKVRRLVIQRMDISSDNKVIYGKKDYIFFPCNANETLSFSYKIGTDKNFTIQIVNKEGIIFCDKNQLKEEDIFEDYTEFHQKLKNEKKKIIEEYNKLCNQKKSKGKEKYNTDDKQKITDNNNTKDDIKNNTDEQNKEEKEKKNEKDKALIDKDSEDEVKQTIKKTFYLKQEKNIFYRFFFCYNYKKEIDGIYTHNEEINLKIDGIVEFKDSMKNLKEKYNTDNDLKSYIIYKNFKSSIIRADTSMIIEIKKDFDLFNLLTQIKQNAKIINNIQLKEKEKDIKLPSLIIGIMCNFNVDIATSRYQNLLKNYKNEDINILTHILDIIKKNKIQVVIGVIKDGKINKYNLNQEDCDIILDSGEKSDKRVDLSFLNRLAFDNRYPKEKIESIFNKLKGIYKSLTYEKRILLNSSHLSSFSNEENKQLRQRIKEMEEKLKKEMEEKLKKEMEEKLKKEMEEKNKENENLKELLSKYYSKEYLDNYLKEKK